MNKMLYADMKAIVTVLQMLLGKLWEYLELLEQEEDTVHLGDVDPEKGK